MKIKITFSRPFDREPSNHLYGEPFDTEINKLIGGRNNWSSPPEHGQGFPKAQIGKDISITLHESGPLVEIVLQNLDQIPALISSFAAVVSAWAAARAQRNKKIPKNLEFMRETGTLIQVGDHKFESKRNLSPKELKEITGALASFSQKNDKS